jgi:hypothetical protein
METSALRYEWGQRVQAAADYSTTDRIQRSHRRLCWFNVVKPEKLSKSAITPTPEQLSIWLSSRSIVS